MYILLLLLLLLLLHKIRMYETEMVLLKLGCLAEQLIITSFILLLRYMTL